MTETMKAVLRSTQEKNKNKTKKQEVFLDFYFEKTSLTCPDLGNGTSSFC